jgi:tetratricopeptide (TPR) repeat protein
MSIDFSDLIKYISNTGRESEYEEVISLLKEGKTVRAIHKLKFNKKKDDLCNFVLGVVCELTGNTNEAKMWYAKAIRSPDAYYNYGTLLLQENQLAKAYNKFKKALELNPNHVNTLNNIATCYKLLAHLVNRPAEELAELEQDYGNLEIGSSLIDEEYNINTEMSYYKRILEIDPENVSGHHNMGHLYVCMNNIELGQQHLEKAYQLSPKSPELCYTLGVLYNGFTIPRPMLDNLSAKFLFQISQVYYLKEKNKKMKILKASDDSTFTSFDINNCMLTSGLILTDSEIVLTHHHLQTPIHRINARVVINHIYENAWSSIQYNSWTYYHWLCETLPRLIYIINNESNPAVPILVPDTKYVRDFIGFIKNVRPYNFIFCKAISSFLFKDLRVVDWKPIDNDFRNVFLPPKDVIQYTREQLGVKLGRPKKYIIWLSRNNIADRKIKDEDAIILLLRKHIFRKCELDVIKFVPEEYSFLETKDIFEQAYAVVGMHGGALSNIMFCDIGTHIIEFNMLEEYYKVFFKHLSNVCDLNYIPLELNKPNLFKEVEIEISKELIEQLRTIVVDLVQKMDKLETIVEESTPDDNIDNTLDNLADEIKNL